MLSTLSWPTVGPRPRDRLRRALGPGAIQSEKGAGASTERRARYDPDVDLGRVSSAALMLSGLAGMVMPRRVAAALDLPVTTSRGMAETRAGLGGTYAALGGWALVSRQPAAHAAVGVTWLGAAPGWAR
jgi:hypothetical protein